MIKDGVIVDTSVLIDFLRNIEPNSTAVESLLLSKRLYVTGIILAELFQGMRNEKESILLSKLIDSIPTIELTNAIWIKAGWLSCTLRKNGINLPITDFAIAAIALEYNLSIFTTDKHFESIPEIKFYKPKKN